MWTTGGGALEYTVTGPTADTEYDLQVRAVNEAGDGPWSATVTGTPTTSVCVSGGAVSDAANTGLVSDCEALLAAEDILAVSVSLNWAEGTPIAQWDGIRLGGASRRVTRLALPGKGLGGTVPSQLGELSMLADLNLRTNQLSGPIPAELGDLSSLVRLNLHTNQLSGPIPDLGGLTGLEEMYLARNMLTGPVPAWLNGMTEMRELWLWGNQLSGTIPDLSGMTSLEKLKLAANNLEGGVPGASALPANLRWLIIQENPLGGTIPDLSGMTRLAVLWLHTNGLTGEVPASHLPPNVTSVNLHSNQLSGEIPDLSGLDKLQWLRLQNNQLSGMIPSTLGEMESLTRLWLHENMLRRVDPRLAWRADQAATVVAERQYAVGTDTGGIGRAGRPQPRSVAARWQRLHRLRTGGLSWCGGRRSGEAWPAGVLGFLRRHQRGGDSQSGVDMNERSEVIT